MGDANAEEAVLLIHGFGANTNHWRFNQPVLAEEAPLAAMLKARLNTVEQYVTVLLTGFSTVVFSKKSIL